MIVYTMSDKDITWPENVLWMYIFFNEIEDEAMEVKYCEPGSNWSVVA